MTTYYNEIEPFAADWLGNLARKGLIADGTIDRRSIAEVTPDDVLGFRRVHFFAGLGGWDYALQLAGWPAGRPVWTGSCPCQPFSSAGKRKGEADERHLWPEMFRLIRECRPPTIFGEQVEGAVKHGWLNRVFADMEGEGYACWAVVLGAHSAGEKTQVDVIDENGNVVWSGFVLVSAPHIRQRLYWVADAGGKRAWRNAGAASGEEASGGCPGHPNGMHGRDIVEPGSPTNRLGHADGQGQRGIGPEIGRASEAPGAGQDDNPWADFRLVPCTDNKTRRVGAGVQPLAYGIPRDLGRGQPELRSMAKRASKNRVGRLRGYGNAIVPQVAAVFIRAFLEAEASAKTS